MSRNNSYFVVAMEYLLTPNNTKVLAKAANGRVPVDINKGLAFNGDEPIDFEDEHGIVPFFFQKDYAHAAADSVTDFANRTPVKRIFYSQGGKYQLLVGVPWSWINSSPQGDLIIDPTTNAATNEDVRLYDAGNYGSDTKLAVGKFPNAGNWKSRSLISFNLAGIPSNATVLNAQMKLKYYEKYNNTTGTWVDRWIQAHQMLLGWDEAQADSLKRLTGFNWAAARGKIGGTTPDANGSYESTLLIVEDEVLPVWKSWDLTALTQKWVSGAVANYGVLLWATNENTSGYVLRFHSSEATNTSDRPYLEVVWSDKPRTVYFLKDHLGSIRATVLDSTGAPLVGFDDYDPWGYPLATRTKPIPNAYLQGASKNRFTEKVYDDEFGLNLNYFGARYYDSQIGKFISVDRFALKYPSMTPFQYAANNPALYIDLNGDTVAVFNHATGKFLGFKNDGKTEWSGVTRSFGNGRITDVNSFSFNDPGVDIQAIRNGAITRVEFVSDEKLQAQMARSGVDKNEGIGYAKEHSVAEGKMDFAYQGAEAKDLNRNTFYARGSTAYNLADFGNYLWGRGMSMLGIDLGASLLGAQYNNFVNGYLRGIDQTPLFNFGAGTNGPPGIFDSIADQRAIMKGYESHYRTLPKRPLEAHP